MALPSASVSGRRRGAQRRLYSFNPVLKYGFLEALVYPHLLGLPARAGRDYMSCLSSSFAPPTILGVAILSSLLRFCFSSFVSGHFRGVFPLVASRSVSGSPSSVGSLPLVGRRIGGLFLGKTGDYCRRHVCLVFLCEVLL